MEETPDFSAAIEKVQEMLSTSDGQNQIQNLISALSASAEDSSANQNSANPNGVMPDSLFSPGNGLDFDTIAKISGIMQAMNVRENNPANNFLHSLKPFLTKNRQKKLEQASKLLRITSVLKAFNNQEKGGG